jgi:hypothetical protein
VLLTTQAGLTWLINGGELPVRYGRSGEVSGSIIARISFSICGSHGYLLKKIKVRDLCVDRYVCRDESLPRKSQSSNVTGHDVVYVNIKTY